MSEDFRVIKSRDNVKANSMTNGILTHGGFAAIVFFAVVAEADEVTKTKRSDLPGGLVIEVQPRQAIVTLMSSVLVDVHFRNNTSRPWRLMTPERSFYTAIECKGPAKSVAPRATIGFGMIRTTVGRLPNGMIETTSFAEDPPEIVIPPGKRHSFSVQLHRPNQLFLTPGRWEVRGIHHAPDSARLVSSPAVITAVLNSRSIELLVKSVEEHSENQVAAWWAGRFLRKLDRDIRFRWPAYDSTTEERARLEKGIRETLDEFRVWWTEARKTDKARYALRRVNRYYGLERPFLTKEILFPACDNASDGDSKQSGSN